jgi:HEAT repeat protein
MACVAEVEPAITELLFDSDHLIRAAAAQALGQGRSPASRKALELAANDRSPLVQEAARNSLEARLDQDPGAEAFAATRA